MLVRPVLFPFGLFSQGQAHSQNRTSGGAGSSSVSCTVGLVIVAPAVPRRPSSGLHLSAFDGQMFYVLSRASDGCAVLRCAAVAALRGALRASGAATSRRIAATSPRRAE